MKARIAVLLILGLFAGAASGCVPCDEKCQQMMDLIKQDTQGGKP